MKPRRKPTHCPEDNVAGRWDARHLPGHTGFDEFRFVGCDFSGADFSRLRYASFAGRVMPGTRFVGCALEEADFADADLSAAVFRGCALAGAVFQHTRLAETDFRSATSFVIDPESNIITGAHFTLSGLPGVVARYNLVVA